MTVDATQSFAKVIEDHLELKRRNSQLNGDMPLDRYKIDDPFENHPLFKSEEQARLEETLENAPTTESQPAAKWPGENDAPEGPALDEGLWGRSRDFDWGE